VTPPDDGSRYVLLVVGPPGSGKSTLAVQLAAEHGLEVFEAEMFAGRRPTFRDRVAALASDPLARAVVVRCCPTMAEQHEFEQLAGASETVVLDVDPDECARRIAARGRATWRGEVAAARRWRTRRSGSASATVRAW
jgi:broad-specificity NMP kinase